ncbi:MAG TPA: SPFH domain-containing protein [Candidatus Merdivicinus faecavium]|nr:SPFH domain-containing protein [Candidatus Merdivicinus faecavium]
MGIIRAVTGAVGGGLADQWLEVIEADNMSDTTVFCSGRAVRGNDRRGSNKKGSDGFVSNGSVVHVAQNQFMLLVDGGKVIDFTAEPGYYTVEDGSAPSLFYGELGEALRETFNRIKFGGVTPYQQKVYFINLQEIKNIPYGTVNPINYFDSFYNAELYLRAHGYFSIRIVEPLKFFAEAIPRNKEHVDIRDIYQLYLSEFMTGLQSAINQMSADNFRISHVASQGLKLSQYLANALDEQWTQLRGMQIESVGIQISYDEESKKLINLRNQGAMLSDPGVREGYVQGAIARGLEAAGSNRAGAVNGFMGMNMGMQQGGGFMAAASQSNQAQMAQMAQRAAEQPAAKPDSWTCSCGTENTGKFCSECGKPRPAKETAWTCSCGTENTGKFCSECGKPRPQGSTCPKCGWHSEEAAKFCPECGAKL